MFRLRNWKANEALKRCSEIQRSAIAKNFLEDANGELTHQEGSTFLKFKI